MPDGLDFERPLLDLENRIAELRADADPLGRSDEIAKLEDRLARLRQRTYSTPTAWQRTQLARHPRRPRTLDYIRLLTEDFVELHGDRVFGDDKAIVGGLGRLDGESVVVIGHQKGRDTRENLARNFGMPHPEGYRKALRLMELAERFGKPILTFIDTPGAYPGVGAEERGQAGAIARNLREMAGLRTPIIAVVIGEGGSGGALAIGVGNRVLMLEYAIYSVISPEGCAAILGGAAGPAREQFSNGPTGRAAPRLDFGSPAGDGNDPPIAALRQRLQPVGLNRENAPHQRTQLGLVDDLALGVEGLVIDLADHAELAQALDAHPVRLRERAEAGCLLGDHADADERDVDILGRLVDPPDLRIAHEPPAEPLHLAERREVLDGQGVGRDVGAVLGRHHADQRVRKQIDQPQRALAREGVERQVAEAAVPEVADHLIEREAAAQADPHAVRGHLLEVGSGRQADLLT